MQEKSIVCVDIRSEVSFYQGHLQDSAHFDGIVALSERQHELPEPSQAVLIVHDSDQLCALQSWLQAKNYHRVQLQAWSEAFKQQLIAEQKFATGASQARVWQPSSVVRDFVGQIGLPPDHLRWRYGLDIGCGAGRDMVYLAMQGWVMTGVDLRAEMLGKAQALAERQQVDITTWQRDCEITSDPFADLADECFGLIHVARYLHRPLFPLLKRLLAPQGYVVYHTFMQGCEAFGSPKNPRFLLAPNELATIFSDYQILRDEVITLADGRPMSAFVARKK